MAQYCLAKRLTMSSTHLRGAHAHADIDDLGFLGQVRNASRFADTAKPDQLRVEEYRAVAGEFVDQFARGRKVVIDQSPTDRLLRTPRSERSG